MIRQLEANLGDDTANHIKQIKSFASRFAKWRFGTLHDLCSDLVEVEHALRAAWVPDKFRFKDSGMGKKVVLAMTHESFWIWLQILHRITSFCHHHRQWCLGCPCHEQACQDHARRSLVFKCPLSRKSMRGPQLHAHLNAALQIFPREMQELAAQDVFADRPDLRSSIRDSAEALVAAAKLKFSFTSHMPWLLWRVCDDRDVAAHIIQSYEDSMASGRRVHRLHEKFCSPPLRAHLEACLFYPSDA